MKKNITSRHYVILLISICALVCIYQVIRNYWVSNCQDKYGLSYNERRKALEIPIIPNNWHIKERDAEFIWWTGNEKVIGHQRKTVTFSGCNIDGELDVYTLPLQNEKGRWLDIEYKYGVKPHPDSIVYTYQIEHTAKKISKNTADSILSAENINKDY